MTRLARTFAVILARFTLAAYLAHLAAQLDVTRSAWEGLGLLALLLIAFLLIAPLFLTTRPEVTQ